VSGILAIRPRNLGDVVLVTPALRALLSGRSGAVLHVVTDPPYVELIAALPGVTRVWPMPASAAATLRLIARLRGLGLDWAVDFFGNPRTALITAMCGARSNAGYDLRGRGRAYRVRVPRTRMIEGRREYAAATHVRLAEAAGGRADGVEPRLTLSARAREEAARILAGCGLHDPRHAIGLVAAGSWPTKTWPQAHAALLARRLREAGREVLLLAGPREEHVTAAITELAPGLAVLPRCDVPALAAVIERLGAVVGTDSGPRHLAIALDVPTYTWFGPTHPDNWTPGDPRHAYWRSPLPCSGCDRTRCPHWNCLPELTPSEAGERVLAHLERHERNAADLRPAAGA
jgi:ADP-heptose:LPS heptosyltransferase